MSRRVVLFWSLIALFRLVYALIAPQIDPFLQKDPLHGDAKFHDEMAWILASEGRLEFTKGLQVAPGYVWLLAGVYTLAGHTPMAARLLNALLGLLTIVGVYLCARRLFIEEKWAYWSAGLCALHPQLILLSGWLYTENLALPLIVWCIYGLWTAQKTYQWVLIGFGLGLLCLTRANFLPLLPLSMFALIWRFRKAGVPRAALIFLGAVLIVAPYLGYLQNRFDRFVPIALGGYVFFWANNPAADGGFLPELPETVEIAGETIDHRAWTSSENPVDRDRRYMQLGLKWIVSEPASYLHLAVKKAALSLSAFGLQNPNHRLAGSLLRFGDFLYWLFLALAAWGLFSNLRAQPFELGLILGLWALVWVLIFAYAGGARTQLPVMPFLCIGLVLGLQQLHSMRQGRNQSNDCEYP